MRQILDTIQAEVRAGPSAIEFEMAYQVRIAIDRIRFAIPHVEHFPLSRDQMRDASIQLLGALDRLESSDRRFQARSRVGRDGADSKNSNAGIEGNTHE